MSFSVIGLARPKDKQNVGGVMRAAHCYSSSLIIIEGDRSKCTDQLDTTKAWRHIPILRVENMFDACPYDCIPIGIELVADAQSLLQFKHPKRAFYIFGPEDGSLGKQHLDKCKYKLMIPTAYCMNLAATVNVVLYDRMLKSSIDNQQ